MSEPIMNVAPLHEREIQWHLFGGDIEKMKIPRPFYWNQRWLVDRGESAPSGWYQWTDAGLVYLGESILEPMEAE